jgi:acetylornithine deacetylase/succinyl-diaminopimelate desuccinylase-like protein
MDKVFKYIGENRQKHQEQMFECLRMETVSADPAKEPEIRRCSEWLVEKLESIGFENASLKDTGGLPVVYADWLHAGKDRPTIMVYGHYDVQPVDPIEKWRTPPFKPTIRDGYVYGRGTCDDKCQFLAHIFALESLMKAEGKLPVNVKVFLESEEEGGAGGTERFVKEHAELLSCDAVVVSDTSWISQDVPTMIYALRGIAYFEVLVKGPGKDLHSGQYGGKVQNTLNAMARIMASLHDEDGRIAIPGIYDDVKPLDEEEREEFAKVDEPDEKLMKELGVDALWGEKGYTSNERNWGRPALDINGVWGGYMGEGGKTVISHDGGFKVSMRLVPDQNVERVKKLLGDHVKKVCPPGVKAEVKFLHGGEPVMVDRHHPLIACAQDAIEKAFGKRPALVREGASVPITAAFHEVLGVPSIMMGFGLLDDDIHSPNERFLLDHFYRGIEACAHFYTGVVSVLGH